MEDMSSSIETYRQYMAVITCLSSLSFPDRLPLCQLIDDPWSVLSSFLSSHVDIDYTSVEGMKIAALCSVLGISNDIFHTNRIKASFNALIVTYSSSNHLSSSILWQDKVIKSLSEDICLYIRDPFNRLVIWCDIVLDRINHNHSVSTDSPHTILFIRMIDHIMAMIKSYFPSSYRPDPKDMAVKNLLTSLRDKFYRLLVPWFQYHLIKAYRKVVNHYNHDDVRRCIPWSLYQDIPLIERNLCDESIVHGSKLSQTISDMIHHAASIAWYVQIQNIPMDQYPGYQSYKSSFIASSMTIHSIVYHSLGIDHSMYTENYVTTLVKLMGGVIHEICGHCSVYLEYLHLIDKTASDGVKADDFTCINRGTIESMMLQSLGNMLSDKDVYHHHDKAMKSTSSHSLLQSDQNHIESCYISSNSEYRRRYDVNQGYAIAFMISCDIYSNHPLNRNTPSNPLQDALYLPAGISQVAPIVSLQDAPEDHDKISKYLYLAYVKQLNGVIRGKGLKSLDNVTSHMQRRFSSRSQFRAVLAMYFLRFYFDFSPSPSISSINPENIDKRPQEREESVSLDRLERVGIDVLEYDGIYRNIGHSIIFFACLAEVQYLRLSCTQETLLQALGYQISVTSRYNSSSKEALDDIDGIDVNRIAGSNVYGLIKTWQQDDSHIIDVMELSIDLLYFVSILDIYHPLNDLNGKGLSHRHDSLVELWLDTFQVLSRHQYHRQILQTSILLTQFDRKLFRHPQQSLKYSGLVFSNSISMARKDRRGISLKDIMIRLSGHSISLERIYLEALAVIISKIEQVSSSILWV